VIYQIPTLLIILREHFSYSRTNVLKNTACVTYETYNGPTSSVNHYFFHLVQLEGQ